MIRRTSTGSTTFAEFCDLIHEDQKADLLDGVIYVASPENSDHNDLVRWLTAVLSYFIDERRLGRLTVSKVAYRLSDRGAPEPDLGFIASNRLDCIKRGFVDGPPDLAIEIVSPDSVERDYELKRRVYEEAGVREYWIIDPLENTVTFFIREGEAFAEQFPRNHVFESQVLTGLKLDTRWLFERPLPSVPSTIHQIVR